MSVPVDDPFARMRAATPARIALPRAGAAIATPAHLAFQLAHARARDAVHAPFDPEPLLEGLRERGLATLELHSAAPDRATYLARPDLGRRLDAASRSAVRGGAARLRPRLRHRRRAVGAGRRVPTRCR